LPKQKKGKKVDVVSLRYLWTDIDPDDDIDPMDAATLDPVRDAILNFLANLPAGVPPPTWIIDSGRGIWAIWELADPLTKPTDAPDVAADETDAKKIREAAKWLEPHEARGAGIIVALNEAIAAAGIKARADSCYNVDMVARLPGTLNVKTGRMAAVIAHNPNRRYASGDFPAVDISNKPGRKGGNGAPIEFPADLPRNIDIDALKLEGSISWSTAAKVREVVKQGVVEGDGFNGHSGPAIWFVMCNLVEAMVDPATMASIILDNNNKIASQVLNHVKPVEYAYRQVRRAFDYMAKTDEDRDERTNEDVAFWEDILDDKTQPPPDGAPLTGYAAIEKEINAAPKEQAIHTAIKLLLDADIEEDEVAELVKLAGKRFGGIRIAEGSGRRQKRNATGRPLRPNETRKRQRVKRYGCLHRRKTTKSRRS